MAAIQTGTVTIADPSTAQEWYKIVTDFPNFFSNYQTNYQGLIAQANYIYSQHPELKADYDDLLNRSTATYNKLAAIQDTVNQIKNKWSDFTGWLSATFGFGFVPLIIAGVSAGAAAAAIYEGTQLLSEMSERASRYNLLKENEAKGMSPQQAADLVNKTYGAPGTGKGFSLFGIPVTYIVIGAALLFFAPTIIKAIRSR